MSNEPDSKNEPDSNEPDSKSEDFFLIATSFIVSVFECILTQIKVILRKLRQLPYIITGTNPYIFSIEGLVSTTIYSKLQVSLFGWVSLFVVAYVTIASQKIVIEYGIFPKDSKASYISSTILGVIVFFCDRFILSYPKNKISLKETIYSLKINSDEIKKVDKILAWISCVIYKTIHPHHLAHLFLIFFRFALAIIISGLLVSTIVISSNTDQIALKLEEIGSQSMVNKLKHETVYRQYIYAIEQERVKYFIQYAISECQNIAAAGVNISQYPSIKATDAIMSSAYKDKYGTTFNLPSDYNNCGISNVKPCQTESKSCPELTRMTAKLKVANTEFNEATKERIAKEKALNTHILNKNITPSKNNDFAGKVEALALIYEEKYEKQNSRFWIEMALNAPLLLILLSFELLPALSKLFFPTSAYDRTIAMQEFYYHLILTPPIFKDIDLLIEAYNKFYKKDTACITIEQLKQTDILQKEKDNELKLAIEKMFENFIKLIEAVLLHKINPKRLIILIAILAIITMILLIYNNINSWTNFIPTINLPWIK